MEKNSCGVLISFIGIKNFSFNKKELENESFILIIDVAIDESVYILINLYNANTRQNKEVY